MSIKIVSADCGVTARNDRRDSKDPTEERAGYLRSQHMLFVPRMLGVLFPRSLALPPTTWPSKDHLFL